MFKGREALGGELPRIEGRSDRDRGDRISLGPHGDDVEVMQDAEVRVCHLLADTAAGHGERFT